MKIENTFTVDAPIDQAWELLTNIPEVTRCLPGAKLTGEEDGVYSGGIKVKVGPVTAEYKGSAEFVEKDAEARKAVIKGSGRDTRGAGNAQVLITAQMSPVGNQTQVDIVTELKISGKFAQFGRGVMQDVSTKLLGQFAECLATKIGAPGTIAGVIEVTETPPAANNALGVSESGTPPAERPGDVDDGALDLLDIAGSAVIKRMLPVAVVLIAVIIIIVLIAT